MGYLHIDNLYKPVAQDILLFKKCYALEKIHGCLKSDTKVTMSDMSEKKIKDIKKGDLVKSYSLASKSFVDSEVEAVIVQDKTDLLPWYCVELANGKSIICTEDHPFLTNKGWVQAKDLIETHELIEF